MEPPELESSPELGWQSRHSPEGPSGASQPGVGARKEVEATHNAESAPEALLTLVAVLTGTITAGKPPAPTQPAR